MTRFLKMNATRVLGMFLFLTLAAPALLSTVARADDHASPGVETIVNGSVDDAVAKLTKMISGNGMMLMGELHQGKVLKMTGLKVQSETVFVGNPDIGKKLFSLDRSAGLVVPFRINIYENEAGKTVVTYIKPSTVLGQYHNPKIDMIAKMLDGKFEGLTKMMEK